MSKRNNPKFSLLLDHLSSDVVTTTEGLESIKEQWAALFESAGDVTVFQSFAWNYAWWKAFGQGYDLFIIVVREKDKLVGLAPFMVRRRLGIPQIEPIGSGQYAFFGLLKEGDRHDVIQAIGDWLQHAYPFGLIHFPYYDVANSSVNMLSASMSAAGWREVRWPRNVAQCVRADSGYDSYLMGKSQKARYNLKRERRKLEDQYQVRVTHHFGPDIDEEVILRMADIQKRSWLSRRGAEPVDSGVLHVIIRELGRADMAEVSILTLGDLDAAFVLTFHAAQTAHCISIAFDETLEHLSPGKALINICIQRLLDRGITVYDFMFGDGEYKRFWANSTILVFRSACYHGLRGWILSWFPHRLHGKLSRYRVLKHLLAKARQWQTLKRGGE